MGEVLGLLMIGAVVAALWRPAVDLWAQDRVLALALAFGLIIGPGLVFWFA